MVEYWNDLTIGKKIKLILTILLGVFVVIFAIRNWESTEVVLVFFRTKLPLTIIILISAGVGFLVASLFDYKKFKKRDKEIKRLQKKMEGGNSGDRN